jgi:hypothetical protein
MKKIVLSLAVAIGIAFPATAGAATFKGIVVAKQVRRHALVVTSKTGLVRTVHTHRLGLRVGTKVAVQARKLRDGTFSAKKVKPQGRAHRARIHGVVARRTGSRYLIAAGHSMLAVRGHRSFSLQDNNGPATGDVVDVTVNTDDNELDEENVSEHGHAQKLELEGKIASLTAPTADAPGEIVLTIGKSTINIVVPAGFDLGTMKVGDSVQLKVALSGDTFTLVKSDEEQNDDGDDGDDDGDNDNHDGGGGGDDD